MKTLVIAVHPNLQESRINRRWVEAAEQQENVTVRRLYELYPDGRIDVLREQELLEAHDRIVLQFPLYWYSSPALLKQWLDDILTYGWAFGSQGKRLHGKELLIAISTGGAQDQYQPGGANQYSFGELLRPFQAMSHMVGMTYLPVFAFTDVNNQSDEAVEASARAYVEQALQGVYAVATLV